MPDYKSYQPKANKYLNSNGEIIEKDLVIINQILPANEERAKEYKNYQPKANKYLLSDGSVVEVDLNGGGGEPAEYLKSIVDNGDGTYTVTDKSDVETVIDTNIDLSNYYNKSEIDTQQETQDNAIDLNAQNITNLGDEIVNINQDISNLQPYFENINVAGPIAIGSTETELFNVTLTKSGNYLGNLNLDYDDSSTFNNITYNVYINNVLVAGRNYAVVFDVGGAGYTLGNIIPANSGDIISVRAVLGSGTGTLSNISAFFNKVA